MDRFPSAGFRQNRLPQTDLRGSIRPDFLERRFRGPSTLAGNHVVPTRDNESSRWVKCWAEALGYDAV
jgi:hypothetical protein